MAVTEVIHFPLWAQLDPCLPFPAQIPSESVSLFPPKLLPRAIARILFPDILLASRLGEGAVDEVRAFSANC